MEQQYVTDSGERLKLRLKPNNRLGVGGQGQVFRATLAGVPVAVKLLRQVDISRIDALRQLPVACASHATLPQHLLYRWRRGSRAEPAGYVMPCIDPETSLSAARLFNFEELKLLKRFTWRDAVLAALLLAESVAALHADGVVIGDLNPENVVFTPAANAKAKWRAVLLDSDSFQIRASASQCFYCRVTRPLYTAPELVGCDLSQTWRQASSDHFALAVLIYQLLLHDHPYDNAINTAEPDLSISDKICRGLYPHAKAAPAGLLASPARPAPQEVSFALAEAFQRSFGPDIQFRPSPAEWVLLLRDLYQQVVPCSRTEYHHHPRDKPCPWCAVERRIGQTICRFPNQGVVRPVSSIGRAVHWEKLEPSLRDAFQCHYARAVSMLDRRSVISQQLLQSDKDLQGLLNSHGGSGHWLDQTLLQRRVSSWSNQLRNWLGSEENAKTRSEVAERLSKSAHLNSDLVSTNCRNLQRKCQKLQRRLSALDTAPLLELTASDDPIVVAELRLAQKVSSHYETWLKAQLSIESLRSWQIEGFGDARLRLLENHGLSNGYQLRTHINRLKDLPGIGTGLQQRLRSHLDLVVRQLEASHPGGQFSSGQYELMRLDELLALQNGEHQLQVLNRDLKEFAGAMADLQSKITERQVEVQSLMKDFDALWW